MKYFIKLVTPKNGIVYDPFSGSGTTLVACKELGQNFVGCELNKKYIKIINDRLSQIKNLENFMGRVDIWCVTPYIIIE